MDIFDFGRFASTFADAPYQEIAVVFLLLILLGCLHSCC